MKTTWAAKTVRLTATAQAVKAAVQSTSFVLSVQASYIAVQAAVGEFIQFLQKSETLGVTDQAALLVQKFFTEALAVTEEWLLSIGKGFFETTRITETQTKDIHKTLDDSDYVEGNTYFAQDYVSRGFDIITMRDAVTLAPGKGLSDTARFSDSLTRGFSKSLFDTMGVTDDIDGQASIKDDETMQFVKVLNEQTGSSDQFSRVVAFTRKFTDSAAATDAAIRNCGKPLADPIFISDRSVLTTTKPFAEAMSVTESFAKASNKVASDAMGVTDSGSLRSQGYVDFSYFAEDYVGDSRTF